MLKPSSQHHPHEHDKSASLTIQPIKLSYTPPSLSCPVHILLQVSTFLNPSSAKCHRLTTGIVMIVIVTVIVNYI